jgi:hypothetical protein
MIIREILGETTEHTVFVEQEVDTKDEKECHTEGNVYIARAHPYDGEYQNIATKGVFQIGFDGFAHFDGHEFGGNIENDNHNTGEYFAGIERVNFIVQKVEYIVYLCQEGIFFGIFGLWRRRTSHIYTGCGVDSALGGGCGF